MKAAPYIYNATDFIPGETPVYYSGPYWDNREIDAAINSLKNGKWLVAGEKVKEFERAFAARFRTDNAVMVNSGSSANLVMIAALKEVFDWQDWSEVIVSPVGFPTTISTIYQNRLTPVFADIEWQTLNFDLNEVERTITDDTVAVFLSPVLGNPPDMDRLLEICDDNNVLLVLDGCDSLGTKWNGRYLNEYAVATSYSFYPAHHITTGEGGMVTSDYPEIIDRARSIAWWGRDCSCTGAGNLISKGSCGHRFDYWLKGYDKPVDHRYVFSNMGYNLKPLDLQGAIGLEQLKKLDEIEVYRKMYKEMIEALITDNVQGAHGVKVFPQADVSWFGVPVIYDRKHELVAHLEANKIQTRNYFAGNILMHPGYKFMDDYRAFPEANKVLDKVFFIGCHPSYTKPVIEYIGETLKKFSNG